MWDAETLFSNEQALAAGTSDNIVDAGSPDAGKGRPVYLCVTIGAGATGTLTVAVKTSDDDGMAGSVEVAKYEVAAATVAKGGTVLVAPLPTGCKRYLQLSYAGGSGGTITAGLTLGGETSGL